MYASERVKEQREEVTNPSPNPPSLTHWLTTECLHSGAEHGAVAGDARALLVVLRLRVAHAVELGLREREKDSNKRADE